MADLIGGAVQRENGLKESGEEAGSCWNQREEVLQ
jgi:hypothetical protein